MAGIKTASRLTSRNLEILSKQSESAHNKSAVSMLTSRRLSSININNTMISSKHPALINSIYQDNLIQSMKSQLTLASRTNNPL
jgi:hypothetical protein